MIPNLLQVDKGIWRGGQPETAVDWQQLAQELKLAFVLKLNVADNPQIPEPGATVMGMKVIYMPLDWVEQTFGEPPIDYLVKTSELINTCRLPMPDGGVFVHCTHGQDRTGVVVGAYRVLSQGWTKEAAYKEMLDNGFHPLLRGLCWAWDALPDNPTSRS